MPALLSRNLSLEDLDAKPRSKLSYDVGAQYTFAHPADRKPRRWLRTRLLLLAGAVGCLVFVVAAVVVFVRARLADAPTPSRAADLSASSTSIGTSLVEPTSTRSSRAVSIATLAPASSSAAAPSSLSSAAVALPTIDADPRLRRVFPGMCYQPAMTNLTACDFTQADVDRDLQLLAQLSPRVRMYSAVCSQQRMALDSIVRLRLDLRMWIGVQVKPSEPAIYASESVQALDLIKAHPDLIEGVIVGNECVRFAATLSETAGSSCSHPARRRRCRSSSSSRRLSRRSSWQSRRSCASGLLCAR